MAVSITQQPTSPNAAYTKLIYVVSGSGTTSNPQYSYVLDVYPSGSTDRISRLLTQPNPAGVGVFEISSIVQGQLQEDKVWKTQEVIGITGSIKTFDIQIGEAYGTSISSSVTIYNNLTSSLLTALPAVINPNGGSYNLDTLGYNYTNDTGSNNQPVQDRILSNDPYQLNRTTTRILPGQFPNASIPLPYKLYDKDDYATVTIFNNYSDYVGILGNTPVEYATPIENGFTLGFSQISIYSGSSLKFTGYPYYITGSGAGVNAKITGSIPGNLTVIPAAPGNLRGITNTYAPSASIYPTSDHIWDSGSWTDATLSVYSYRSGSNNFYNDFIYLANNQLSDAELIEYTNVQDTWEKEPNRCNEKTVFSFINEYGTWDYFYCYNPVRKSTSVEKNTVALSKVDYSSANSVYSIESRGDKIYNSNTTDEYVVTTQLLDQYMAQYVAKLIDSPSVYVNLNGDFVPIVITNSNYTNNLSTSRNKTFTYTIQYKYANQRYSR